MESSKSPPQTPPPSPAAGRSDPTKIQKQSHQKSLQPSKSLSTPTADSPPAPDPFAKMLDTNPASHARTNSSSSSAQPDTKRSANAARFPAKAPSNPPLSLFAKLPIQKHQTARIARATPAIPR